jgi:hypothetical protein
MIPVNPAQRKAIAAHDQNTEVPQAVPSMLTPNPIVRPKPQQPPTFNAQPKKDRLFKL